MIRVRDGDPDAFTALVERFHADILGLADRTLRDRSTAEDVVQETFLRVYKAREGYQATAAVRTWIYRIAVNLCVSEIRTRKRRKTVLLGGLRREADDDAGAGLDPADDRAPAPSSRLEDEELAAVVRAALEDLPENQRVAMILSKFHDMPYKDIGDTLDMTPMAVKSLLARARATMRDRLPRQALDLE